MGWIALVRCWKTWPMCQSDFAVPKVQLEQRVCKRTLFTVASGLGHCIESFVFFRGDEVEFLFVFSVFWWISDLIVELVTIRTFADTRTILKRVVQKICTLRGMVRSGRLWLTPGHIDRFNPAMLKRGRGIGLFGQRDQVRFNYHT